jgi:hypothetical protein
LEFFFLDGSISGLSAQSRGKDLLLLSAKALPYELFKHPKQLLGSSNSNTLA